MSKASYPEFDCPQTLSGSQLAFAALPDMPRTPALVPRKGPRQGRSRQTVATILEAAARVFEEAGPDGATTNAIAERAGVSIGSLYQYFPNKLAIIHALIDRYQQELREVWDKVLATRHADRPLDEVVDQAIDGVWGLACTRPAFLILLHSGGAGVTLAHKRSGQKEEARTRIAELVLARNPSTAPLQAQLIAMVVSETVHALLALAAAAPRSKREAIINETKRVVSRYVSASIL